MAEAMLELRDITVRFGGILALNAVNLSLESGKIHALIGPNGAGKTTLVSVISGERKPTSGHVILEGKDINAVNTHMRARLGLTRTYQLTALFDQMSVRDNILLSLVAQSSPRLSLGDLVTSKDKRRHSSATEELLTSFHLIDKADIQVSSLSYGDRRRLEIAMAIGSGPKVLLLDEPLAGLSSADSLELVRSIETTIKGKIPVLLIEHDMEAVFQLADVITVMVNGTVLESASPEQIRTSEKVQAAYLSDEEDF